MKHHILFSTVIWIVSLPEIGGLGIEKHERKLVHLHHHLLIPSLLLPFGSSYRYVLRRKMPC